MAPGATARWLTTRGDSMGEPPSLADRESTGDPTTQLSAGMESKPDIRADVQRQSSRPRAARGQSRPSTTANRLASSHACSPPTVHHAGSRVCTRSNHAQLEHESPAATVFNVVITSSAKPIAAVVRREYWCISCCVVRTHRPIDPLAPAHAGARRAVTAGRLT